MEFRRPNSKFCRSFANITSGNRGLIGIHLSSPNFRKMHEKLSMARYRHTANDANTPGSEIKRSILLSLLLAVMVLAACLLMPGAAQAQWPNRAIHLIVPYGAGSNMDTIARLIAAKLGEQLRQTVIVENKVGGGTIIGTNAIAKSAADGYTLGLANTTSQTVVGAFTPNLPFDPIKDFSPIAMIATSPFVLIGSSKGPAKTLDEFVALAKANPGKLSYASAGMATLTHLAGELVARKTGIDLIHVPYRGAEQSMIDVVAGRIDLMVGTIAPTLGYLRSGNLRALAVMSETRSPLLPDVPTIGEAGAPGCEAVQWIGLVAPAGIPDAIIKRLNSDIATIVNSPEVQKSFNLQGITPAAGSTEAMAARIRADIVKWKEVAIDATINGTK
jgi:tripartite-type tricarboxylate transporter receptor subunit TctC